MDIPNFSSPLLFLFLSINKNIKGLLVTKPDTISTALSSIYTLLSQNFEIDHHSSLPPLPIYIYILWIAFMNNNTQRYGIYTRHALFHLTLFHPRIAMTTIIHHSLSRNVTNL